MATHHHVLLLTVASRAIRMVMPLYAASCRLVMSRSKTAEHERSTHRPLAVSDGHGGSHLGGSRRLGPASFRPEQRAVGADSQSRVLATLCTFPAAHREAFVLRAEERFSYAEIAQTDQTRGDISLEADREGWGVDQTSFSRTRWVSFRPKNTTTAKVTTLTKA